MVALSEEFKNTFSDVLYIQIAEKLNLPIITLDEIHISKGGEIVTVTHLKDFESI
ncbi:MAG: hypothetical protein ACUVTD_07200 [Nitrososphaerales archaeon]